VNNADFTPGVPVRVAAGSLNMRSGPGTSNPVVVNLPSGITGTILSHIDNGIEPEGSSYHWYYLSASGHTGWCAAYSDSSDYLVLNKTGYGNDCSGFASICWRLPSRYTTWTFEHDASNSGGYVDSLGAAGSGQTAGLIRGDALNDDYNHIVLFNRDLGGCTALFVAVDGNLLGGEYVDPDGDANARSIGLLIRYGGFDYLTLGDLTGPSSYHPDMEGPLPPGTEVVINQVCPFGAPGEFVELYNSGGFPVSLAGWTLDIY